MALRRSPGAFPRTEIHHSTGGGPSLGALSLLAGALSACSFFVDFPDVVGDGGAPGTGGTAGASVNTGGVAGMGGQPTGGQSAGGAPDGGGPTGGGPVGGGTCTADSQAFTAEFDEAAQLGTIEVDGMEPEVIAIDADGDIWWAGVMYSGTLNANGNAVQSTTADPGGVYLLEIDAAGHSKRGFVFGVNASTTVFDIVALADGNIALVGSLMGTLDFGDIAVTATPPQDAEEYNKLDGFIAIFDPAQNAVTHAAHFGDGGYQEITSIAQDSKGDLVVATTSKGSIDWGQGSKTNEGITLAKLHEDLSPVWSRELQTGASTTPTVAVAVDDSIFLGGATVAANVFGGTIAGELVVSDYDAFVAHYTTEGSWLWHRILGDDYYQGTVATTLAPDGDVVVAGTFLNGLKEHGTVTIFNSGATAWAADDVFIARFAADTGVTRWLQQIHGESFQNARDLKVDCADRVIVSGTVYSPSGMGVDFGDGENVPSTSIDDYGDLFIATYKGADGSVLFKSRVGDDYEEIIHRIELDAAGHLWVAGGFFFSIVLDPGIGGTLASGSWDFFIARYLTGP
ncbi:MAG: hypothetical protein U0271_02445 [Polyangiaceae bacterium]